MIIIKIFNDLFSNYEKIECPVCRAEMARRLVGSGSAPYYKCGKCHGTFVYPRKDQAYYLNHKTYLTDPEDYIKLIDPKGFIWLLGKFEEAYSRKAGVKKGNMLEIGAGVGYFMMQAFAREWGVEGIETSKAASDWANKYLRMDVHNTTIEDFSSPKKYDAIVMIEVLEHFLDARKALQCCKNLANDNALLFGTTPNTESKYWNGERNIYDPDDHIFLFSKKTIELLFSEMGIGSLTIEYFGGDRGDAHLLFSGVFHK